MRYGNIVHEILFCIKTINLNITNNIHISLKVGYIMLDTNVYVKDTALKGMSERRIIQR